MVIGKKKTWHVTEALPGCAARTGLAKERFSLALIPVGTTVQYRTVEPPAFIGLGTLKPMYKV